MSIFENIKKSTEEIKNQIESEEKATNYGGAIVEGLESFYSNTLTPKMKTSEYLRAALGWVYGCVNVIADEAAGIELKLMEYGEGRQEEIDDHEALDVIYRANNAMTRFDLIQLTFQYLELTGEAPWFISFKNSKPDQIILLRPDRLTIKPGENGELIGGYKYRIYTDGGMKDVDLDPFEVVHFKYSDPDQPLRGKGPLQAAAITYDLDNYAEKWNSQFFKNSASPSAALYTDKVLATDVRKRLEAKIKEKYQGLDNAHNTMVLENGLKWQAISLSQKDMDFMEQQKFSREKILAIFRVPPTALGLTTDVTRSNAEATDYVFAKRTIKPKMTRFVEQLNEFFLPLFGDGNEKIFFDFEDPVPQNVDQEINRAQSGVQTGYMTINEAREIVGLDPIEDGDTLRDPMSFAPALNQDDEPMKATREVVKKPTRYQKHLHNARTREGRRQDKNKKVIEKVVTESLVPIVFNYLKDESNKKKNKKLKAHPFSKGTAEQIKNAKYAFQEKQLNVASKYEQKVINKLATLFDAQKSVALKQIDNGETPKLDVSVEVEKTLNSLKPVMTSMMREQARLAFQIVGVHDSFNDNPKASKLTFLQRLIQYFEIRTFRFATEVSKETNAKMQDDFAEGVKKGESIPELKKRVSSLFTDMAVYRSERIARTETILASNFSTEEAYKESGVVEAKEWLATRDERTDDECIALDGKIVKLGGKFFRDGYFSGETPPIHVNCRCTLIPVISA